MFCIPLPMKLHVSPMPYTKRKRNSVYRQQHKFTKTPVGHGPCHARGYACAYACAYAYVYAHARGPGHGRSPPSIGRVRCGCCAPNCHTWASPRGDSNRGRGLPRAAGPTNSPFCGSGHGSARARIAKTTLAGFEPAIFDHSAHHPEGASAMVCQRLNH